MINRVKGINNSEDLVVNFTDLHAYSPYITWIIRFPQKYSTENTLNQIYQIVILFIGLIIESSSPYCLTRLSFHIGVSLNKMKYCLTGHSYYGLGGMPEHIDILDGCTALLSLMALLGQVFWDLMNTGFLGLNEDRFSGT